LQVDDDAPYSEWGPDWSDEEGAELLRELCAAFDGLETPPPDKLARVLPNHPAETAQIVRVCAGHRWDELSADDLRALRGFDFERYVSDEAFPVLVAAYLRQSILAPGGPDGPRFGLEDTIVSALNPNRWKRLSPEYRSETVRRIRAFPPAQLRVLRRFMELTQRQNTNPPWPESEGGRFWASLPVD